MLRAANDSARAGWQGQGVFLASGGVGGEGAHGGDERARGSHEGGPPLPDGPEPEGAGPRAGPVPGGGQRAPHPGRGGGRRGGGGTGLRRFGLPRSVARLTVTGGKLATEILPLPEAGA